MATRDNLREAVLAATFCRYDGNFKSGIHANNKIKAEQIQSDFDLERRVCQAVGRLAIKYQPDLLVSIPDGGNWLTTDLGEILGLKTLLLMKNRATESIDYYPGGLETVESASRIVLVEDVPNRRTTTRQVLQLPGLLGRVQAEVAILDRGIPGEKLEVPFPVEAAVVEPIPAMLSPESELWKYVPDRNCQPQERAQAKL